MTLGAYATVGGVQTRSLQNNGAVVGASGPFPTNMPAVPLALLATSGTADLSVPSHGSTTIAPGSYRNLMIGDHAAVQLSAGTYSFNAVSIADHVSVVSAAAGVDIRLADTLNVGTFTSIRSASGTASKLTISTSAANGPASAPAVALGANVSISALIAAPNGTLSVADHASIVGALSGFDVSVGDHASISYQSGFASTSPAQVGAQQLTGYANAPVASAPIIGPGPPHTMVSVGVGLPSGDAAGMRALADAVSNPADPSYLQYLTVSQFADRFGSSATSYGALTTWATNAGLMTQAYPSRLMLDVTGEAAVLNQALHVTLVYGARPDGSTFFEADRQPSVDTTVTILRVSGLDDFVVPKSADTGTGPYGFLQSVDLREAFIGDCGFGLAGEHQSVGIFAGEPYAPGDITQYIANTGLDVTGTQEQILAGNGDSTIPPTGGGLEIGTDIEMVLAMAPHIDRVVIFNGGSSGLSSSLAQMAARPEIHQFTDSFDAMPVDANANQSLAELAIQGQSFFSASGDYAAGSNPARGKYLEDLLDIRDNPYVTLVGGTNLTMSGGSVSSETGWDGSGGGPFVGPPGEPIPYYQMGLLPPGISNRSAPDVSAASTGVYLYLKGGDQTGIAGTSLASPEWGGMMALINQSRANNAMVPVGFANPLLYGVAANSSLPPGFRDMTSGNNGYAAGVGYDLVTGLGSPTCQLVKEIGFPVGAFEPTIHVSVGSNAASDPSLGPAICVFGKGFLDSRGDSVSIALFGIPNNSGEVDVGDAAVQPDGTFHFSLPQVGSRASCDGSQLSSTVSVAAGSPEGDIAGATVPGEFWCTAGTQSSFGSCD